MITKTVRVSRCYGQFVRNEEFFDYYNELPGFVGLLKATRKLRRMDKDPTISINRVEHYECIYSMPLDKFIAESTLEGEKYYE